MIVIKQQICALMQADEDVLKINTMPVQQQTNSVDCGILSMAFLTCIDENSNTHRLDEKLLGESSLQMLPEQQVRRFPTTENNAVKCKFMGLHFSCRQPWFSEDATAENKQMAECCSCRK